MDRTRRRGARALGLWLAAATLYGSLAAATIALTSDGSTIATVWPSNAVLVALLLLGPAPRWITVLSAGLFGNLAANWITRGTISGPLLYSLANGVEVVIAVALIRADAPRFAKLREVSRLLRFIAFAGVAAPTASAVLGAATAALVYAQPFEAAFATWLLSDALGLLVFTPVFVSVFNGDVVACFASKTFRKRVESVSLFALTAAVAWVIFFVAALPALFMLFAPVMLVTFRVGPLGTKLAVMIVAVVGAFATAIGTSPVAMVTADPAAQAHLFQAFLAVMLLTCLPVAAEIEERSRLAAELIARERKAVEEAVTDLLTGILNRRGFERAAEALIAEAEARLCYVAIDVDRFKQINDQWGHQFGDDVLQHLGEVLRAQTRPGDLVGRLGGDEFALLLRTSERSKAEAVCARIQAALRAAPIAPDERTELMISISCGAADLVRGDRLEDVYRRADAALYSAKRAGRNTVRLANAG